MKLLSKLDLYIERVLGVCNGIFVLAMFAIVNIQVLIRYVFRGNLGMLSDLPVYLLVYAVFFSASLAVKHDDHIKIEIIDSLIKNRTVLRAIQSCLKLLMFLAMAMFCYHCFIHEINLINTGNTDPATKIPYWVLNIILPISSTLMTVYYGVNTIKSFKRIKGGADN
ncbi:MAG: TRAP transporter small permease [Anaerovoracaceae bacterium]